MTKPHLMARHRLRQHVLEAVVLLSSDLDDEAVVRQMVADGCPGKQAWKLAVLVPMAFVRVAFAPVGVRFLDHYLTVKLADGALQHRRRRLAAEPAFQEATRHARQLASADRLLCYYQVVRRSAEFAAIEAQHRRGSGYDEMHLQESGLVAL